jgi:carbamoyltransferase
MGMSYKILGINVGHDSGATLIDSVGRLSCINEERLSRKKMHLGFPRLAIDEVLAIQGVSISELSEIAIEGRTMTPQFDVGFDEKTSDWKKDFVNQLGLDKLLLGSELGLKLVRLGLTGKTAKVHADVKKHFSDRGFKGKFTFVDHHECHAASAYFSQPHDEGLAITIDASGEGYCAKVYRCKNNRMEELHRIPCYHSPAYYYAYVTQLAGFKPLRHEGKITGLAAFGDPNRCLPVFEKYISFDAKSLLFRNSGGYHHKAMANLSRDLTGASKEDIAAAVQTHTENITRAFVDAAIQKFNGGQPTRVFLAGGLFANVKLNQRISASPLVKSLYVFPNMGDGGLNFGAAVAGGFASGNLTKRLEFSHLYLGRPFSDQEIEEKLKAQGVSFRYSHNVAADVAQLLHNKKVVARFVGPMEYGPRALGARSIIYSPADKSVNTWLNQRLNRTEFMPFAPYVRDVDAHEYFRVVGETLPYQFMTVTCDVSDKCKQLAPAIVHVDGTARPQVVMRDVNPSYYDILTEYEKLSGCGVLVNTSFNMHEEPIINTPDEAIETYKLGGLDVLAIGNFIVGG